MTAVGDDTAPVDIGKFAFQAPAATVTLTGTMATEGLLLESGTTAPPVGAAVVRCTYPVEGVPPSTPVGYRLKEARIVGTFTLSTADLVASSDAAEIVTEVETVTGLVDTAKVAFLAPGETVTVAGAMARVVLLLESVTVTLPAGAAVIRVTVPVEVAPPVTVAGLKLTEERRECWNRPVGLQLAPRSVLLNTPISVPA